MSAALPIGAGEPEGRIAEINTLIARKAAALRRRRLEVAPGEDPTLRAYCYASDGRVVARYERSKGTPYSGMSELLGLDDDWPEASLIEVWKEHSCIGRLQRLPGGELVEIEPGWPRRLISPLGLWEWGPPDRPSEMTPEDSLVALGEEGAWRIVRTYGP